MSFAITPVIQFRIRIYLADNIAIGPGRVSLLEAIHETGSISAAARQLGMSYRRAWSLVNSTNQSLKSPAVVSSEGGASGGGSQLTKAGLTIIRDYREAEDLAAQAAAAPLTRLADSLKLTVTDPKAG